MDIKHFCNKDISKLISKHFIPFCTRARNIPEHRAKKKKREERKTKKNLADTRNKPLHTFQSPLQIQNDSPNTSHHFKISLHPLSFPCPYFSSLSNPLIAVCGNYSLLKTLCWVALCFNKPPCYHRPQSLESQHAIDTQTACFKTTYTELIRTIEQRYRLDQEMLLSAVI